MGRLMGPVRADRLTRFLPLLAIYQTEVPSKQEFHTLLTMWLLSAAAPAPINRSSSFLPSLPCFSLCLSRPYFNPSWGFCLVCCQKKRQDPDFKIKDQCLVRDVWWGCDFVFKVLCWFSQGRRLLRVRVLKTDKMMSCVTLRKGNKLLHFSVVGIRMKWLMSWKHLDSVFINHLWKGVSFLTLTFQSWLRLLFNQ